MALDSGDYALFKEIRDNLQRHNHLMEDQNRLLASMHNHMNDISLSLSGTTDHNVVDALINLTEQLKYLR